MANRKRGKRIVIQVTDEERNLILERVKYFGFSDMSTYIRKTAIDVTVVNVNTDGLKELATQVSRVGNNINQLVRLYHQDQNLSPYDVKQIIKNQQEIVSLINLKYDELSVVRNRTEVEG